MSTLLYGQLSSDGVPSSEEQVRRNTAPVQVDAPPAEAQGAPDFNEVETDPNPEVGMGGRQLAPDLHPSEQYTPFWLEEADAPHNAIVNDRIASSGTAAQREARGEFGHGTAQYSVAIEPVIREGGQFGQDYFVANEREGFNPNSSAVSGVQPSSANSDDTMAVAAYGRSATRDASAAAGINAWYAQVSGKA